MEHEFNRRIDDHIKSDERNYSEIKEHFAEIKGDLKTITDNHLSHIQASIGEIEKTIATINTNQTWQLKFFWIIASVIITTIIGATLAVILK